MIPRRDPIFGPGSPTDNLIVPERPELPEINVPPHVNLFRDSIERIERRLDSIESRLKEIESKLG